MFSADTVPPPGPNSPQPDFAAGMAEPPGRQPGGAVPEPVELPNNPGSFEELHRQCQSLFPMFFDGAKLLINKGLSNHFHVSHTMNLSTTQPSSYRFGATYVGNKMLSPSEAFPLLMADIDPSGNLNANLIHAPSFRSRVKMVTQIQAGKWQSTQFSADYKGDNYSTAVTLANPDLVHGTGVAVLHYLHSITSTLALGAEVAFQASPAIPNSHMTVVSLAGRAKVPSDGELAFTLSNTGRAHLTFYQKCSANLQIGVETETSLAAGESSACVGYQFDLPKADFLMRGSVDTNFDVKAVLEKKLTPLPFTLAIAGLLSHRKKHFLLGIGLILG